MQLITIAISNWETIFGDYFERILTCFPIVLTADCRAKFGNGVTSIADMHGQTDKHTI